MTKRLSFAVFMLLLSAAAFPSFMYAQQFAPEKESSRLANDDLPDAPGAVLVEQTASSGPTQAYGKPKDLIAPKYRRVIKPGYTAQRLSGGDKLVLALATRASLGSLPGLFVSAGISHWEDGAPHFGVDRGAFGERLGVAEIKQTSEAFFSYGVYADVFHDDPRYYVMGSGNKVSKRAIYAASRVVITRKDDGSSAVNWAKLAGILSAAALTNAYYPDRDRKVGRTFTSSLTSVATTAGTNQFNEFLGDVAHLVFHKKRDPVQQ